jgi:hypothetical protein
MIRFYRKKPVVISAMQINEKTERDVYVWSDGNVFASPVLEPTTDNPRGAYWQIITLLGSVMTAIPNDYIIRGVNGEFYPCKKDIFEKTYEQV